MKTTDQVALAPASAAVISLLMSASFVLSYLTLRASPVDLGALLLLLLPLYWVTSLPTTKLVDGWLGLWLTTALVWLGWMISIQALLPAALPSGWWHVVERSAGLVAAVVVIASRPPTAMLLRLFGLASALSVTITCVVNIAGGVLGVWDAAGFGFGNVNILMCTAGPALIAWSVYLIVAMRRGEWPPTQELIVWIVGSLSLLTLMIATSRRGVALALGLTVVWFVARWCWAKYPRLTAGAGWVSLAGIVVLVVKIAPWTWTMSQVTGRSERIGQYLTAVEGIRASFPWGFGNYGALHLQQLDSETTRHATAIGSWGMHIHNEFLDTWLNGGPLALVLMLVLTGLTIRRVFCVRDPALRLAFQAMGIALLVHLNTDNTYGEAFGQVWFGVVMGLIWSAPTSGSTLPALRFLPPIRWLAWPLVLLSCWGATRSIYPAVLHQEAEPSIRYRCLKKALEPQLVNLYMVQIFTRPPGVDARDQRLVIDEVSSKMGWTTTLAIQELRYRLGQGKADVATTAAFRRAIGFIPFNREVYQELSGYLTKHPDQAREFSPDIQRRLMYLTGKKGLPKPSLDAAPATMDTALDLYAALSWSIANGVPWAAISAPLEKLVAKYGNVSDIAQFTCQAAALAPPETFSWLPNYRTILSRGIQQSDLRPILQGVVSVKQATAILPLLQAVYPNVFEDRKRRTVSPFSFGPPEGVEAEVDFYCEIARIAGLAQRSSPP
jgi:O-Antigen ligase